MQCQLCDTYYHAERVEERASIGKGKELIIINRFCKHRDAIVNEEDEGCEKFTPAPYFWCKGWISWVTIMACKARQAKDRYRTCPCSLGIECLDIQIQPKVEKKQLVIRAKKKLVIRGIK